MKQIRGRIDYESLKVDIKIDAKDKKILLQLSQDSRIPLTTLAKRVALSRDAVAYRIKRLEKLGVIIRFFPKINYEKLGYYTFHVFLLVDEKDQKKKQELVNYLTAQPNVINLIEYTDTWDYEAVLIAKDPVEFDSLLTELFGKFPDLIIEKHRLETIRDYNDTYMPPMFGNQFHNRNEIIRGRSKPVELDALDLKILKLLCENSKDSTYNIGQKLKVSPDTVSYRVKGLVEKGVIRYFTILVNLSLINYHWFTFCVGMRTLGRQDELKIEQFVDENHSILSSSKMIGGWDILFYIAVEDPREFHRLIKDLKILFSNVIRNYQTWVAYKEHLFNPAPNVLFKN